MLKRFLISCALLASAGLVQAQDAAAATGAVPTWLVLGDSLSAAYGIPQSRGWVALLQQRLSERGYRARVVNASVSGETTAGGLARLPALLAQHKPALVLVELGGNDGLRALPVAKLRDNLDRIAMLASKAGARPVIFEMLLPPNYGADYAQQFAASFALVARHHGAPLVPFLLAPIATDPAAFQDDGIHPLATSEPKILDAVWPHLEPLARP
ncbi:arylesterase [Solimonas soli]|uniref:arylesterase n=1 Tax=Solimonas soli TaxID=413479 RepID=UPI003F5039CC